MLQMNSSHLFDKIPHTSPLNGTHLNSEDGNLLGVAFSITSQAPELFLNQPNMNNNPHQYFSSDEDHSPITPGFSTTAFLPNQDPRFGMSSFQTMVGSNMVMSKSQTSPLNRQSGLENPNTMEATTMSFSYVKQMCMDSRAPTPLNYFPQIPPQPYPLPTPPPEKNQYLNRGNEHCIPWSSQETSKSEYTCPPSMNPSGEYLYSLQNPTNKPFTVETPSFNVGYIPGNSDRSSNPKTSNGLLYPCIYPNCQKFFTSLSNLRLHSRIHSSDRPFKCNICLKFFLRNHDLRRHEKIHLGLKPYPCSRCGRCFGRSDAMKRHMLMKRCAESSSRVKMEENSE
ncbi:hypothetical protein K7432_013976 [Basidiobolus ranarum]|uniref:C2H2-type domain-containing protein n=1 Tax=Basidiobolus ranarum TaxID=34480 RepID=A0ABR2WIB0_9FUNG